MSVHSCGPDCPCGARPPSSDTSDRYRVRMTVRDAPTTWKGIAQVAAVSLASIAQALYAVADALSRKRP